MRESSDAGGGRGAEEGEVAEGERLREGDFECCASGDEERRRDEEQERRDEDDRQQRREENRGGDHQDVDAAVHRVSTEDNRSLRVGLIVAVA